MFPSASRPRSIRGAIERYVARYLPAEADESLLAGARLVVWFAHIFLAVKLGFLAYALSAGMIGGASVAILSVFVMSSVLWLLPRHARAAMHLMALGGWAFMTSLLVVQGGLDAPSVSWLVLVPTGTVFVLGRKAGLAWFLVSLATAATLLVLDLGGHLPTSEVARDVLLGRRFVALVGLAVILLVMMSLYQANKERLVTQIRASNRDLAESRDAARAMALQLESAQARILSEARHQQALERELRQVHKLEAVGRLAAGVAHELNTPLQFVSDSVAFVDEAMRDLGSLIAHYRQVLATQPEGVVAATAKLEEALDLDYLLANVTPALGRSLEGLERMSTIIKAMGVLASPERSDIVPLDINSALDATLAMAHGDCQPHADVVLDLGELPLVMCRAGEINQVFLSLLMNASEAVAAKARSTGVRGRIIIRSTSDADGVHVSVIDTGVGIAENIRNKVFEPFFTTKPVGRGTGQGLSIARAIVVDKHGGTLEFTSEPGRGATFVVYLPFSPFATASALAA